MSALLEIRDLTVQFFLRRGTFRAVDRLSFSIERGEAFGLVGESGCGKTISALSILRLIPSPPARIVGGEILFEGKNILPLSFAQMRRLRGAKVAMIFQEPMTSLNPLFTLGHQISASIELHQGLTKRPARTKTIELLERVGIPSAQERFGHFPHQFSGGMRQRVMIAMALSCQPPLLIADEPTTALDVTIQAQILDLLSDLQREYGMALLYISHNLPVVATICNRIGVMYAGNLVELTDRGHLFSKPLHPYTKGLIDSMPGEKTGRYLPSIPGQVCDLMSSPSGCLFHPRCSQAMEICSLHKPSITPVSSESFVTCHLHGGGNG
jgi:oligopeptide/dipeptide ABC transporter ATP-binding protein